MFIFFGLVELSFVAILRNSHLSYYCLQHYLMDTAQLLTVLLLKFVSKRPVSFRHIPA